MGEQGKAATVAALRTCRSPVRVGAGALRFHWQVEDFRLAARRNLLAALLGTSLGIPLGAEQALEVGERIWNLERVYNVRAGLTKKDDALPPRMLKEPLGEGMSAGHVVPLEPMLVDYYRLRGWDAEGRPTREKLAALRA